MPITLIASQLSSRNVRQTATQSSNGIRVLDTANRFLSSGQQDNSFFGSLFRFGLKATGWIVKSLLGLASFSFSSLWGWMVNAGQRLVNFDWNASDAELKQLVNARYTAVSASWGAFVGSGLGWLAGVGLGYGVSLICPVIGGAVLARYVASRVLLEGIPEIKAALLSAIQQTLGALAQQASISAYINGRKFIKRNRELFPPELREVIDQWGSDNGPRVTIAETFEQQVEKLPILGQVFVEEAVDEFFDSFIEAGFIVASELDQALAAAKAAQPKNPERGIILYPDRENPRDKIVLAGTQTELIPQVQGVLDTHRSLDNRDVGQITGQAIDDYVRDKELSLRLRFQLFNRPAPPYGRAGSNELVRVTITVPDVKRSALSWDRLRFALGGENGYLWGRFKARGRIDAKRYVTVYGGTEDEAVKRLKAVMELSDARIQTINVTEELKDGDRLSNPRLQKQSTKVYPGYVTIINRERVLAIDQGRASVDGQWRDKDNRFNLWRTSPPPNFDEQVRELLRFAN